MTGKPFARGADPRRGPLGRPTNTAADFWARVTKTSSCWLWDVLRPDGYGRIRWGGHQRQAHSVAWELEHGIVLPGFQVLHRCDNRGCVRPSHLFLGTQRDNLRDCSRKGRISRGEDRPQHKLTTEQVRELRARASSGESYHSLARRYGVSRPLVTMIVLRQKWAHVT